MTKTEFATADSIKACLPAVRRQALHTSRPILDVLAEHLNVPTNNVVLTPLEVGGAWLLPSAILKEVVIAEPLIGLRIARSLIFCLVSDQSKATGLNCLYAIMLDPWDEDVVKQIRRDIKQDFLPALSTSEHINSLLDKFGEYDETKKRLAESIKPNPQSTLSIQDFNSVQVSAASIATLTNLVVRFVDTMLLEGFTAGASDLHFESSREGICAKFRLDGVLLEAGKFLDRARSQEVISRLKVLAALDVAETRIPQDGRFKIRFQERDVDFRLSIMPSGLGEDAVLRLLDKSSLLGTENRITLHALGFDAALSDQMLKIANRPHGMLLVTGPTGSGKTTTLYALLAELHSTKEKIITIEDPVEYELPGILQIPVNDKKGLTFAKGLRSILRHDPDRILVGEIRDSETAEIAVQASLTGHQVYTTVHANDAFDVLGRFVHLNVDLFGFASAVNAVAAQRLIRVNCIHCSDLLRPDEPSYVRLRGLCADLSPLIGFEPKVGAGCSYCRETGFKGRTVIAQLLVFTDELREKIVQRGALTELKALASKQSSASLKDVALKMAARGQTTIEEIERVVALG